MSNWNLSARARRAGEIGRIGENIVESHINDILIPKIRKRGWDDVIYTRLTWFRGWEPIQKFEIRFLIYNEFFPTRKFLNAFKKLTGLLENAPDGFLIKLKRTGKFKLLKEALRESSLENDSWSVKTLAPKKEYRFNASEHDENEVLPVVEGEIEVIEVKTGKAFIMPHQAKSYRNILKNGYKVCFYKVSIISSKKNQFEIEEKILKKVDDLKCENEGENS